MSPSVPARAHALTTLAFAIAWSAGCSAQAPFAPIEVRHATAERVVRGDDIEIELLSTRYLEDGVALSLIVRNRNAAPVRIDRQGLLLGVADLEFPLDPEAKLDIPRTVAGGAEARVHLQFATGAPIDDGATLHLRALHRQDSWLRLGPVPIDPAPVADAGTAIVP